jgi:hypothetical protein
MVSTRWSERFVLLSLYQHEHGAPERRHEDELADLSQRHRGSHPRMNITQPTIVCGTLPPSCRAASILAAPTLPDNKGTRLPGSAVISVEPAGVELAVTVDTCHGTAVSRLIAK